MPKQFVDTLDRDISYETYNVEIDACDYVDCGDVIPVNVNDIAVLQLNVRGLYSKLDQIKSLLNDVTSGKKPDIVLLCETWQNKNGPIPSLEGYSYVHKARTHKLGGGVGIFVSKRLRYNVRPDLEIS